MACETRLRRGQTRQQRVREVKEVIEAIDAGLVNKTITPVVSRKGGIAFKGISDELRQDVSDACVLNQIMRTGTLAAKIAIQKAERAAGRTIDRALVATGGHHSHDGGHTWHGGH